MVGYGVSGFVATSAAFSAGCPVRALEGPRKDIREVCNTYGTSMAFPLIYDATGITFGCLTLDTPSNVQLDIAAQEACGQVIVEAIPGVLEIIATWGSYRIG